jgi:hypothetical protein
MTMPNFLIIGAAKFGTSSLYTHLKRHPDVYMSLVKEPHFFALEGKSVNFSGPGEDTRINSRSVTALKGYRNLFGGVSGEVAIGEASPLYLYSPDAPGRIQHYIPEAKLIVILRNPADRAYSAYMQLIRDSRETLTDFAQALDAEEEHIWNNWSHIWHYKRAGFYYPQLKRYCTVFDPGQIKVYLYEDLITDPVGLLRNLFVFIGVDGAFAEVLAGEASVKHNVSGFPRSGTLNCFLMHPNPFKSILKPLIPRGATHAVKCRVQNWNLVTSQLSSQVRRNLVALYREDILKLQGLIGRDLSGWLKE